MRSINVELLRKVKSKREFSRRMNSILDLFHFDIIYIKAGEEN